MKKMICVAMGLALMLGSAACGRKTFLPSEALTGTPREIFAQLKERAEFPMSVDNDVTADNAAGVLGLTADEFRQYVLSAVEAMPMLTTQAQTVVVAKCKDAVAAAKVKQLISAGFDINKWTPVEPEQISVVESGSYVLLVAGSKIDVDAIVDVFSNLGNIPHGANSN